MNLGAEPCASPRRALPVIAGLLLAACGGEAPFVQSATVELSENGAHSGILQAGDLLGRRITFALVIPPSHGTLLLDSGSGAFTYTAAPYFNGKDAFTYTANAGGRTSAVATVSLVITPVDYRPVVHGVASQANGGLVTATGAVALLEDGVFTGQLEATDPDMQVLVFQVAGPPAHGTLELDPATGAFTYRPLADWNGTDAFSYTAFDGALTSDPAEVTLVVAPVNDPPMAQSQTLALDEDATITGQLVATDVDGDALTYSVAAPPAHGSLLLDSATGAFTYRPLADWNGTDAFTFTATDGQVRTAAAIVTIVVRPVNDPPVAQPQAIALDEDTVFAGQLAATDVDGPLLTFAVDAAPIHGTLDLDPGTGSFLYRPAPNYNGPDEFTYAATDGLASSQPVPVTIEVRPVNDAPVAQGQAIALDEDTVHAGQLAASDVDGDPLTFAVLSPPLHGSAMVDPATGAFTYRPMPDYNGPDEFSFTASDGRLTSLPATVSVEVRPVNDAPVAQDQAIALDEDTVFAGQVAATDVDSTVLTYAIAVQPAHGTMTLDAVSGAFSYRPAQDYNGPDGFTFVASDGSLTSGAATVSITVRPVNDPPVAEDQSIALDEDTVFTGQLVASDPDGDPLRFAVVDPPRHGRVEVEAASGSFVYRPTRDFAGRDSFRYVVDDGTVTTPAAYVEVVVREVNDAPVATPQTATVPMEGFLTGVLGAVDAESEALTFAVISQPANGSLAFDPATQVFNYRPATGYIGPDSFTFTATDGLLVSEPATVSIRVLESAPSGPQVLFQQGVTTVAAGQRGMLGATVSGQTPLHFVWWRNGVRVPNETSPVLRWGPLGEEDDGTSYTVTAYDLMTSSNSLPWVVRVVGQRPGVTIRGLSSNHIDLFPSRQPLAVRSLAPATTGIGVTISLAASDFPAAQSTGEGSVQLDGATGSLTVSYQDDGTPAIQTTRIDLTPPGGSSSKLELRFANAAWMAQQGRTGPGELSITEMGLPPVSTRVEDWLIGTPTAEDVAFAEATWGGAVAGLATPTERAQALARVLIDQLEVHRGVPSDLMSRSHPFEQWRLATSGQGLVWCTNIAAIYALACKALSIPARIGALGRTQALGSEYILQTAEGHATIEIFDEQLNQWVWIDPTIYALGIERQGVGWLDAGEVLESLNDAMRLPSLRVVDYDPVNRTERRRPIAESAALASFSRFFRRETSLTYWRVGLDQPLEYLSNELDLYPRVEAIGLKSLEPIPEGYGVRLTLTSVLTDLDRFEYRLTDDSNGPADQTVRSSPDGIIDLAFANAHSTLGQTMIFGLRAVGRDGSASAEQFVMVSFYSRELYRAHGLTNPGVAIFDGGGLRMATSVPSDWLSDVPTLDDVRFARQEWGALVANASTPLEAARRLASSLIGGLLPRRGVPSDAMRVSAFEQYRRVALGLDAVDSRVLASIFAHACASLGIPARVVEEGRVISSGADFRLLGAEERAAVEVFDATTNRWVWMDLAQSLLGVELPGFGLLNAAELMRAFADPVQAPALVAHGYDAELQLEIAMPAVLSSDAQTASTYFRTFPRLRYSRGAP